MNTLLSNLPNDNMYFTGIVVGLFALVTVYFGILLGAFKKPFKSLIVPYIIIIFLLILVILISNYYTVLYENFTCSNKDIFAGYMNKDKVPQNCEDANKKTNQLKLDNNFMQSKTPFADIFNVDGMCKTATPNKLDHDDISWKCRVRKTFGQNSFDLTTAADDVPNDIKVPLKYDGIHNI